MRLLLQILFGWRIRRNTARYLRQLQTARVQASRLTAARMLRRLRAQSGAKVTLGKTTWGDAVEAPVQMLRENFGVISGATGSGKTRVALLPAAKFLECGIPFGGADSAKSDWSDGVLYLLGKRLAELGERDPEAAKELRRRIYLMDFSLPDPVTPFNILALPPGEDLEFFIHRRTDQLLELLSGDDQLSLGAREVLRQVLFLLALTRRSVTEVPDTLDDEAFRLRLLADARCSAHPDIRKYFARGFGSTPLATRAAIKRRISGLFSSTSLRLSLSAPTAPDFARMQDESRIVIIRCGGANIPRTISETLQGIILSDIDRSRLNRKNTGSVYPWFFDEAQALFRAATQREHLTDLLTLGRSAGIRLVFLTQNVAAAVPDARLLRQLDTNVAWTISLRSEPADCAFLHSALPVTGRRRMPAASPFGLPEYYSLSQERDLLLEGVRSLPNRAGYLWLKTESPEALRITTADMDIPSGEALQQAIQPLRKDQSLGRRISRKAWERFRTERDGSGEAAPSVAFGSLLEQTYEERRRPA